MKLQVKFIVSGKQFRVFNLASQKFSLDQYRLTRPEILRIYNHYTRQGIEVVNVKDGVIQL